MKTLKWYFLVLLICGLNPSGVSAETVWQSATAGYWTNPACWSGGVPGYNDDVVFTNTAKGNCTIDTDVTIRSLNVCTGYAATISFAKGVAGGLTVSNDLTLGTFTKILCTYATTNGTGTGRVFRVLGNATINGAIDANGQGFPISSGPGKGTTASHGGYGSWGPGALYGSLTEPLELGSGGYNSIGGGAIRMIVAGTLTLNGLIQANSDTGNHGGSGGSVWLIADTFAGNGFVSAEGFGSTYGGGGGRVAIQYTTKTFTGAVSVAAMRGSSTTGQPGTLYAPGFFPSTGNNTITNSFQYFFQATTNTWNLSISGSNWVEFHGGTLVVTNLLLRGGPILRFDRSMLGNGAFDMTNLAVLGNIVMTNAVLHLPVEGTYTLAEDLIVGSNSTLYIYGNTGDVNVASGGTTPIPHGAGITIGVAGQARIDGNINANGNGFPQRKGPGYLNHAASHGGDGSGSAGKTYGQRKTPSALGSGGYNMSGGGAMILAVTNSLTVNGSITANGLPSGEGGSGGSVWLRCNTLAGSGLVSADGGGSSYGGGGGRVALDYQTKTYSGIARAAGGTGTTGGGQPGTVYEPAAFPATGDVVISQSGVWDLDGATNTWSSLTVSNGASATFLNGRLVITNLTVKDGATLRLNAPGSYTLVNDIALTNGNLHVNNTTFAIGSLSLYSNCTMTVSTSCTATIAGSVTLALNSSLDLAKGVYTFSQLSVGSNSTLYLPPQQYLLNQFAVLPTATIVCRGDTGIVNQASGGTVPVPHGSGVLFRVSGAVLISGTISADGQGFPTQKGPGYTALGGSYGGDGYGSPGKTYGSRTAPTALGSGGWNTSGGGAIRLEVLGDLTMNGRISASPSLLDHSGSGGSIWISCSNFAGSGTITADSIGGASYGGGGGRISLEYTSKTFSGLVSASGCGKLAFIGQPGTIYETGPYFPSAGDVVLCGGGRWDLGGNTFNWDKLTLTNGVGAYFENGTVSVGTASLTGSVWLGSGTYTFGNLSMTGASVLVATTQSITTITGALSVAGSSIVYLPPQTNNLASLFIGTNSIVYPCYPMGLTNAVNPDSGGTTNSRHGVGAVFNIAGDAVIRGTINVDETGFVNLLGYVGAYTGPGGCAGHAASYGGKGVAAGPIYGQLTRPSALGSGGYTGKGGGAIKLVAGGQLVLDGLISANGGSGESGSGGSIWLRCDTFSGGGTNRANATGISYAGGGGRVAVEYRVSTWTGSVQVTTVTNPSNAGIGYPGTYYACQSVTPGSDSENAGGVSLRTAFSLNGGDAGTASNGVKVVRSVEKWKPYGQLTWTDTSLKLNGNVLTNVATYTLSGFQPNRLVRVQDNGSLLFTTNSGPSGTITFSVTLDGAHTLSVPIEAGTLIMVR